MYESPMAAGRGARLGGIQPGYLPWLGYFDQMRQVDVFVIADEMPFSSSGWLHRNRVKGPNGPHWLTLPVHRRRGERINQVRLAPGGVWKRRHLMTLQNFYAHGVDVEMTLDGLGQVLDTAAERVVDVSIPTVRFLAEHLGVRTPLIISSQLGLEARYQERFPERTSPTHRIIAYMEALGTRELLGGESGQEYFDVPLFESFGFRVVFHRYAHPTYPQLHGPFVSHMSAIDLLLCIGAQRAQQVLAAGKLAG